MRDQPILSESAALRDLDLPSSRREWLRGQLEHARCGSTVAYKTDDVRALRQRLASEDHRDGAIAIRVR